MAQPDIFTNVHKGIRRALFDAVVALGRASEHDTAPRAQLHEVLRFVSHHGDNEDTLLVPMLADRAPDVHARMTASHARIHNTMTALEHACDAEDMHALYNRAAAFTAMYLDHMREEETEFDPLIRAALSADELAAFGRRSVERTAPADQRMMLGWMLPAMTETDVNAFLSRVPAESVPALRALASPHNRTA
jgi:hypothetical protein